MMMMMMDEEMEFEPLVFEAHEFDIDYEFDAAMYFDFTREESCHEAREADRWFQSAGSYPPSPFAAKLILREGHFLDNGNAFDSHNVDSNNGVGQEDERDCLGASRGFFTNLQDQNKQRIQNQQLGLTLGPISYNHSSLSKPKVKALPSGKPSMPRGTSLMKPTASHLARQNWPTQPVGVKLQKVLGKNSETSLYSSGESQAIKKQKLDGGHSRKVNETNQQTTLVHKLPKKDGIADKTTLNPKLRLTIPREPELETAHRAQRIRSNNRIEEDRVTTTTRRFKARPLNRKILEAPSLPLPKKSTPKLPEFQEFHLRTLERAMQNSSAVSSSSFHDNNSNDMEYKNIEARRLNTIDDHNHDGYRVMQNLKSFPLNTKIFSSKGDIDVFRNSKQEATIPLEFKFNKEKTILQPPTELFNKLSLTSQLHSKYGSDPFRLSKSSKENSLPLFHPENKITPLVKETPILHGKRIHMGMRL